MGLKTNPFMSLIIIMYYIQGQKDFYLYSAMYMLYLLPFPHVTSYNLCNLDHFLHFKKMEMLILVDFIVMMWSQSVGKWFVMHKVPYKEKKTIILSIYSHALILRLLFMSKLNPLF